MSTPAPSLVLGLLFVSCFALAARLELWRQTRVGQEAQSASLLAALMGDSRRLFATHFFVQADVYLHSGYYPSIFDRPEGPRSLHLASETASHAPHPNEAQPHTESGEPDNELGDFLGKPRDWIDAFGRNFYPSRHSHLEESTDQREILPWLRLSADLDPHRVETYAVAAFWMRTRMGKVDEAEKSLREGLSLNPESYEILFELGRVLDENRRDTARARNVWELALKKWEQREAGRAEPDLLAYLQITGHLAQLEERAGNLERAVFYLKLFQSRAPHPAEVQKRIDELRQKMGGSK